MAPVKTVRMRVLRSFYIKKDDIKTAGQIVEVPVSIARMLVTDGKAEFVRDPPPTPTPPAENAAKKADPAEKTKKHWGADK